MGDEKHGANLISRLALVLADSAWPTAFFLFPPILHWIEPGSEWVTRAGKKKEKEIDSFSLP